MKKIVTSLTAVVMLMVFTPTVHADDQDVTDGDILVMAGPVCKALASRPNVAGILAIGQALLQNGYTSRQAGQIVARSIIDICPEHMSVLDAFIATYAPDAAHRTGLA